MADNYVVVGLKEVETGIVKAINATARRTITAMSREFNTELINDIFYKLDRVKPYTLKKGYRHTQARPNGKGSFVSEHRIMPNQAAYVAFVFGEKKTRVPGDPGTNKKRIWVPTYDEKSTDQYGGIAHQRVKALISASNLDMPVEHLRPPRDPDGGRRGRPLGQGSSAPAAGRPVLPDGLSRGHRSPAGDGFVNRWYRCPICGEMAPAPTCQHSHDEWRLHQDRQWEPEGESRRERRTRRRADRRPLSH